MSRLHTLQSNFSTGQLDDPAQARSETALYRNGARSLRNCIPLVTGGVLSRPGSWDRGALPGLAVLAEFSFSLEQSYVAAFGNGRCDFFDAATGAARGSVSAAPWSTAILRELRFAQLGDVMWVVHSSFWPQEIQRTGLASWSLAPMVFDGPRGHPTFRYAPAAISVQTGLGPAGAAQGTFTLPSIPTNIGSESIPPQVSMRGHGRAAGSSNPWVPFTVTAVAGLVVSIQWVDVTLPAATLLEVEFDGNSRPGLTGAPYYTWPLTTSLPAAQPGGDRLNFDGDWLQAGHYGTTIRMRDSVANVYRYAVILEVISPRVARVGWATAPLPVQQPTAIWEEAAMSSVRGFPRSVCLYQQRLVFGGFRDAGSLLYFSATGQFRNFDLGEAKDSDAIAVIGAGGVRTIRHIVDGPQFTILTENGTSIIPVDANKPLTPATVRYQRIGPHGTANARPSPFDGGVLMVVDGGMAVRDLSYTSEADNIQAEPVSLQATGFLGGIIDAAYLAGSNERPEELAFFVNTTGRMVVFHSIRSQKIGAWFEWTTSGQWLSVAVAGKRLWAVVVRKPGEWRLEQFDTGCPFDAARPFGPLTTSAPLILAHLPAGLEGQAVSSTGDYLGTGTITANGTYFVTRQLGPTGDLGTGSGIAGVGFEWWIDPLPPAVDLADGTLLLRVQRLIRSSLRLYATQSARNGGEALVLRRVIQDVALPPAAISYWWITSHLGFARRNEPDRALTPRITRDQPLPVGVLAMKREVRS